VLEVVEFLLKLFEALFGEVHGLLLVFHECGAGEKEKGKATPLRTKRGAAWDVR
jgi:hypothetical protein